MPRLDLPSIAAGCGGPRGMARCGAAFVRRAEHALERRFHLVHQLEANQFFIDLAAATRDLEDIGLYHWVGEHGVEGAYAEGDERAPIPDGWGRLLTPDCEVLIHLEWDRGTEQPRRLRAKLAAYAAYFNDRPGVANQVLFGGADPRTRAADPRPSHRLPRRRSGELQLLTTTTAFIATSGALGAVWAASGSRRVDWKEMAGLPRSERATEACVGKPGWWLRRPGGGAGA